MKIILITLITLQVVYSATIQEQLTAQDCKTSYMNGLNYDLVRQSNCFAANGLRYAGDIPNVDWDLDKAEPYLNTELYWVIKNVVYDLANRTNAKDYMNEGTEMRWFFHRGYSPLSLSLAQQYYYANGLCGVKNLSISNPVLGYLESGSMIAVLPIHPIIKDEGLKLWRANVTIGSLIYIIDPDHKYLARKYPEYPYYDGDNYVLFKVANAFGNMVSNVLLQRMFYGYGIPYASANKIDNKLSILESGLFDDYFNVTVHQYVKANQTKYGALTINSTALSMVHFILPHPKINITYNVQAFKYYYNYNNVEQIAGQDTNVLDVDTQNKLLTATPIDGYKSVTCEPKCTPQQYLDLVFVIDGSGSVTAANFKTELEFVVNVTKSLPLGQDLVRVGVVVFSTNVTTVYDLDSFDNFTTLNDTVLGISYPAQLTYTGLALAEARAMLTDETRGARGVLIPKLIVIVTDGKSNDCCNKTEIEAALIHEQHLSVVAIGVGSNSSYNVTELQLLASEPISENVYPLTGFNLSAITGRIETTACTVPSKMPNEPFNTSATVYADSVLNMEFLTAAEEYMLLIQTDGTVLVYMTYYPSETIPSEYEYDLMYNCVSECRIPVPAMPLTWIPNLRRSLLEPGHKVNIAMKFIANNKRADVISFNMSRVPYNADAVSAPVSQEIVPATQSELDTSYTEFKTEYNIVDESVPEYEDSDSNPLPLMYIVGAGAGAMLLATATVMVVIRKKKNINAAKVVPV